MLLPRLLLVLGLAWASFAQAQTPSLTLDTVQAAAGQSVGVPLRAQGLGSAIAVQVDIRYDPQVLTPQAPEPGTGLNGHSVDWRIVGEGILRLVVYTDSCVAVGDGSLVVLAFDVAASAAGRSPLTFAAALATDGQGAELDPLSLTDGAVVIEPSARPTPIPATSTFGTLLLALALVLVAHRARYGRFYLLALAAVLVTSSLPDQPLYAQDRGAVADIVDTILERSDTGEDCNDDGVVDVRDLACLTCAAPRPENQPPQITSTPVTAATSGVVYSYQVIAEDPDQGDSLIYSLPLAPAGMSIGANSGLITWTPTEAGQVGVQVQVTDSGGLSATQDYQITVTEENPPQLLPVGDRTIPAGDAFTTRLFAVDPDPGDTLSFSLTTAPDGMGIDPSTGDLTWTPPAAGENTVTARVTDSTDRSDTQSFTVTVTEPFSPGSTNSPPTLAPIADQTLTEGDTLGLTAEGSDPDDGDTLTYSLAAAPDGMVIDESTGAIGWVATPPGTYDVTVLVEDQGGLVAAQAFIVTVEAINAAPTANDDVYIARKGETLTIPAPEGVIQNDSDPNDDPLSATRLTDPTRGTIDSFSADGSFSYTPGEPPGITIGVVQKCRSDLGTNVASGTLAAADVDQDGDVELVGFVSRGLSTNVIIVDPSDCSYEQFEIGDDMGQAEWLTVPTLVNLDDDPELEVVSQYLRFNPAIPAFDERLFATNLDGTPIDAWVATNGANGLSGANSFDTGLNSANRLSGPVAVDLDGDGNTELVVGITNASIGNGVAGVTSHAVVAYDGRTGAVIWEFIGDFTSLINRSETPNIVDLDLDGDPEIIWSHHVLDHEGNLLFNLPVDEQPSLGGGKFFLSTAVANFDNDPFPEILGIDRLNIRLYSHDGQVQWEIPWDSTRSAGFPWSDITIAELDGDPFPEFVVMLTPDADFGITLYAFDSDGQELWNHGPQSLDLVVAQFGQTLSSSPVAIDLDRDGIDELIQVRGTTTNGVDYAGLYIFDGETGAILDFHPGQTQNNNDETLTVADIDGDGSAEIVTNINTESGFDPIEIWDHLPGNPFPPAPRIRSGTRFQTSWANEDGSIPASLEPFWLQPGQNGWNRLAPPLDPLNPESDSFTYRVSDGEFDSNTATVNIEIRPNGNPPFFLSEPVTGTSRGVTYEYDPLTVDVDPGDVVTYALVNGPAGMTIDPDTGSLRWNAEVVGDYPVSIVATDTLGLSSAQIFTVSVGDPVTVPDVVGSTEADAEATLITANLRKGAVFVASSPTVPAGQVLSQSPPAGSAAAFGSAVALTLSLGPTPLDRDDDGDGFSENDGDCNDADDSIFPGANDPEGDGIDQDCDGLDGNKTLVAIEISPGSKRVLTGEPTPLIATGIFDDGTAQNLTAIASWSNGPTFSAGSAGAFQASATFRGVTGTADFTVLDRVAEDLAPIARIDSPASGEVVTAPTDIEGLVSDANLLRWELAYRYAGEDDFVVFEEGGSPAGGGPPIGEFDPTTLLNGLYDIRLRAYDRGGNVSEDRTVVEVDGGYKPGAFTYAFLDLAMPLSGLPISVYRNYDSRKKSADDFGVGWSLDVQTIRLQKSRERGSGWRVNRSGLSFSIARTDQHLVTITMPDGRVEAFDLVVTPQNSAIVPFPPFANRARFVPRPGTRGTLETLENDFLTILGAQPGPVEFLDDGSTEVFDPDLFLYTAESGARITIRASTGVEKLEDRNGNTLIFSDSGIEHSSGASVLFTRDAQGRITRVTDARGNPQDYTDDANGNLTSHRDAEGNVTRFAYDRQHNLISIQDPLGNTPLRNEYDSAGRLVRQVDAEGNAIEFTHDPDARQQVNTDRTGAVTVYTFDERGNTTSVTDAMGNTTQFTYDGDDNMASRTDALGNTWRYEYNAIGLPTSMEDPLGNTMTRTYDSVGNLLSETSPRGNTRSFEYDARGNLVREIDATGAVREYSYDDSGNPISATDRNGNRMTMRYDAQGRLVGRTFPSGSTEALDLDPMGNVLSAEYRGLVDGVERSIEWRFVYDANGNVISTFDPVSGERLDTEYDANGQPVSGESETGLRWTAVRDARGDLTSVFDEAGFGYSAEHDREGRVTMLDAAGMGAIDRSYDALGRTVATSFPDTDPTSIEYDAVGQMVATVDAAGIRTEYAYDEVGRQSSASTVGRGSISQVFDADGNIVSGTDVYGGTYTYAYDDNNRRTRITRPDGWSLVSEYDDEGNLVRSMDDFGVPFTHTYNTVGLIDSTQDAAGNTTRWTYDALGRVSSASSPGGRVTRYIYDERGRLTRINLPSGATVSFTLDRADRRTSVTKADGDVISLDYDAALLTTTVSGRSGVETYRHDLRGNIVEHTDSLGTTEIDRDTASRMVAYRGPYDLQLRVTRDGSGRAVGLTSGGETTTIAYGPRNGVTRLQSPEVTVDIRRDLAGLVTEAGFDDGTQLTTGRNAMGLAVSNTWAQGASPIISESRVYDVRSRIDAVTWSDGAAYAFGYDAIGQLASSRIETAGGLWDSTYEYDADYNLSRLTRSGTVLEFSYDANDRLIQAGSERFGWDPNGNLARVSSGSLVETLTYDVYDRLIRFIRTGVDPVDIRYEYDYDGLLRSRCDDDGCSRFLWDRSAEPYPMLREEVDESGSLVARYYHDGRYLTHSVAADGTVRKYALDHVGSPVRTIEGGAVASSVTYDAFGVVLEGTPGRIGWGNALLDEDTGLLFMRSRWYSPAMRRFIHADSAIPDATRPASLNRYVFAANDPVNRTDPSGQTTQIELSSVFSTLATIAKSVEPLIAGGTTLAVGWAAANATQPGGAFKGEQEVTAKFYNPDGLGGVRAVSLGFPGKNIGPLKASAGLSRGIEFIDVYARSFRAGYRFVGPSIGIGKSASIFKKLGSVSYGASLIGKSEIYNVYRQSDYEGLFAAVTGAISVPPNIKAALGSIAFKLLPLNGGGGSLFWSPFRETVNETTGDVIRPSWGWRLGVGHTTKTGGSLSLSFTYYFGSEFFQPYLP